MFLSLMSFIIMVVFMLVSVAFITLLERKVLGYMQLRLGPNKVGFMGILQPLSDAVKLYTKELSINSKLNKMLFFVCPLLSLSLSLVIWIILPMFYSILSLKSSLLMFLSILGLGVYPIFISGWSSNSNYSMLGAMRSIAQTISYEVSLIFIIMSNLLIFSSMSFQKIVMSQYYFISFLLVIQTMLMFLSIVAELNRTPFDFSEGESELVSGFNTEYSGGSFAIIFMAEYMMILFFSTFMTMIFFGVKFYTVKSLFMLMMFLFMLIWIRATLPRYRYDKLMFLSWKIVLPLSSFNLMFSIFLSVMKM